MKGSGIWYRLSCEGVGYMVYRLSREGVGYMGQVVM